MKYTTNDTVFVEPFKDTNVKSEVRHAFATILQKIKMTGLKVLVGDYKGLFPVGATVYVNADLCKQPWANKAYELEPGVLGISLPVNLINYVEKV